MITQAEIKAARKVFDRESARLREELEDIRHTWEGFRRKCRHPNGQGYTDRSGVGCTDCPDCGGD